MVGIDDIQKFFFKAMQQNGYSSGGQKITIPSMPGYKAIPFREGDFSLLDCWCTTPHSQKSAGTTTIFYKDSPVWWMQYNGWYTEEAISFLKLALSKTAETQEWLGGRGPKEFTDGRLVYRNDPRINDFAGFNGYECIIYRNRLGHLGYHEYSGFLLI